MTTPSPAGPPPEPPVQCPPADRPRYRALVVTASQRAAAGVYPDKGGPLLADGLSALGFLVEEPLVVPDGEPVCAALREAVAAAYDVVVTTGGTGISPTDRTPEMTRAVLDYEIPGIPEALRAEGLAKVPTAARSRGLAGVAGATLIINLPGSSGGVRDGLAVLGRLLAHAVDQLRGGDHARPAGTARPAAPGEPNGRSGQLTPAAPAGTGRTGPPRGRRPRRVGREPALNACWPVALVDGPTTLRPIRLRDQRAWREVNRRNREWLRPWEATIPPPPPGGPVAQRPTYRQMVRHLRAEAHAGRMLPFVVDYQGRLAGQLTVAGITWGSMCSGHIGYWVDKAVAGRGVMPTAVALAVDHCFRSVGLHRVEVCIRPENIPSRRVVEKLGFREEGLRPRYLHIDGAWRDHLVFALTVEEVLDGLLSRWHQMSPGTSPI